MADQPCTVCLTFDFDGMSIWIGSFKSNNPSMISRGEFGTIGLERLLQLFSRHDIPATFFVPGHTAWAWPDLVKRIADAGHEIGHHGWVHENPALELDAEREVMERGFEALDHAAGLRPVGYRSAAWDFSPNTIDLLLEYGLLYSSSCMANDFYPYYLRKGDRWSTTEPYEFGELVPLVEIAPSWGLDDFPPFEHVWGFNSGLMPPRHVEELWREEFDYMLANCPGGVFNLTCHPQFIGRGSRVTMLERLVEHFKRAKIARTLLNPGEVIVLDEPTAVLSEADADHLLARLLAFRGEGKAIVYVSHRLSEVLRIADRITVLRDGRSRGTFERADVDRERIITLMAKDDAPVAIPAGAALKADPAAPVVDGEARPLLETDALSAGRTVVDVNLRVLPGEITGIAGVQGSGHGALLSVLAGRTAHSGGVVRMAGRPVANGSVRASRKAGLLLVPADRRRAAIVPSLSLRDNLVLSPKSDYHVLGFRRRRLETRLSQHYVRLFSIRAAGVGALSGQLSGGNQQKLALARAIESNPSVLLLEEPTQGIAIHSKREVRALINAFVRDNPEHAVVVATSEFEELLDFADRVHVMRLGRLVASMTADELTYTKILHHALP